MQQKKQHPSGVKGPHMRHRGGFPELHVHDSGREPLTEEETSLKRVFVLLI